MIDLERAEDEAYERLLGRILKVFGPEIHSRAYNKTQEAILNTMIAQAIDRSGGCDSVTIAQLWGIKELLENEFTLAAALDDED
jgi:hypothetical protein